MFCRKSILLVLVFVLLATSGCSSQGEEAKKAVERFYRAMESRDTNAYLDSILPSNRLQPNAMSALAVLGTLSGSVGVGGMGLGLDFGQLMGGLTEMSFPKLELTVVQEQDGYVLVEARGNVRYPGLFMEMPFCDQHDVRQEGGKWYVDVMASERRARLQRILEIKEAELRATSRTAPPSTGTINGDLMAALSLLGDGMQTMMDLCE